MNIYYTIQARQTGKTTELLEKLENFEDSILIVQNLQIKNILRNKLLNGESSKRIFSVTELNQRLFQGRRDFDKIFIDEYDFYSKRDKKNIIDLLKYKIDIKFIEIITTLQYKVNYEYLKICKFINKSNFEPMIWLFFQNLNENDKKLLDESINDFKFDFLYDSKTQIHHVPNRNPNEGIKPMLPDWQYEVEIMNKIF